MIRCHKKQETSTKANIHKTIMAEFVRAMAEAAKPIDFTTYQEISERVDNIFKRDWEGDLSAGSEVEEVELTGEMKAKKESEENKGLQSRTRMKKETGGEAFIRIRDAKEQKNNQKIKRTMKVNVLKKRQRTMKSYFTLK